MQGYFRKRKDKWTLTIDIGIDLGTGKREQMTQSGFASKKEARAACVEMITELESGIFSAPSNISMEKFMRDWLESKRLSVLENTWNTYSNLVRGHIIPTFGRDKPMQLTPGKISKGYANLFNNSELTESTVAEVHKVLNAAPVKKTRPRNRALGFWNGGQAKLILSAIRYHREYIAFKLELATGMRQSEILGLRWKDILLTVTLDGVTLSDLQVHRRIIVKERMESIEYQDNDLVIPTTTGKPLTTRNPMRTLYRYIDAANAPHITFHDLRHTDATLLLAAGENPRVVAERLGHAEHAAGSRGED